MANYKIFPTKDNTIYSEQPIMNTGLDSIIEMSTYVSDDSGQTSRTLIQFSQTEIANLFTSSINGSNYKAYFRGFAAKTDGLNLTTTIEMNPISQSWGMGTGHYGDLDQVTNGSCWLYRIASGSNLWSTSSYGAYATASYDVSSPGGGVWYTGSSLGLDINHSQIIDYSTPTDLNIDVTNTINTWNSGGLPNNGFIIKQKNEDEFNNNTAYSTTLKYFSIDTHTIYPPHLEFKWDDYSFSTGSSTNTILNTDKSFISITNNSGEYYSGSIQKFRIKATPKYPTRTFTTSSIYSTNYYLPESSSLYAIKDTETNLFVVDFDSEYSRISADEESSYFTLWMDGLEPERNYTILIKTEIDGSTKIFNDDLIFKVLNS